uniref:Protein kinase domain-containing protein n=2 Tax=Hemiselmis andersenii TaxID=464988 RepID=A0A6U2AVL0_HEMAN|mmetsp:Transcript_13782/g.31928  ORF Transcript_13782/g.31928 Transcript_13782/m.31928 type:complete len:441 (+) Transcript_13782:36-1358(+)
MSVAIDSNEIDKRKDEETGVKTVNQFEIVKLLGKGAFGKVKLCKDTRDGKLYALKIMDKNVLKKKRQGMSNMLQSVQKEIAIMKKLNHKNIVIMHEVLDCPSNPKLYIRLEYVEGGQSMPTGNDVPPLDVDTARRYFHDLIAGIEYLHFNNVLHRDIKPENLLVTNEGLLKVADFGVSQVLETDDDLISKSAGTPAFMAPECCRPGQFHGKLADLWACGCTLYMFVHGSVPFVNPNVFELYEDIQHKTIVYDESKPDDLVDLLKLMLNKDVDERLKVDFARIKTHPWFVHGGGAAAEFASLGAKVSVSDGDLQDAITSSREIVLMVKISAIMKKRLASAREKIEKRNSMKQLSNNLEGVDLKGASPATSSVEGTTPSAAGASTQGEGAALDTLPSRVPDGFAEAPDSDNEDEDKAASMSPLPGGAPGAPGRGKSGRCTQQ